MKHLQTYPTPTTTKLVASMKYRWVMRRKSRKRERYLPYVTCWQDLTSESCPHTETLCQGMALPCHLWPNQINGPYCCPLASYLCCEVLAILQTKPWYTLWTDKSDIVFRFRKPLESSRLLFRLPKRDPLTICQTQICCWGKRMRATVCNA